MKLSTIPLVVAMGLGLSAPAMADESEDIALLKKQVRDLQQKVGGNNLKFNVDYRVTHDDLEYERADGSKEGNSSLLSNRLLLNMGYQYNKNLVFSGQLSYNKAYGDTGQHMQRNLTGFADFDWIVNENLYDNEVRVKEAYFLYLGDALLGNEDIDWTFSLGRRPSTNGFLGNHREGYDKAKSPLAHSINVEFDGLSFNTKLEDLIGVPGSSFKICAGRGLSNARARFSGLNPLYGGEDYTTDSQFTNNIDMVGFIMTPFNNGQYDLKIQYYEASNMIGMDMMESMAFMMDPGNNPPPMFKDYGNLSNLTISLEVNGIGEFISDFLDNTTVFASYSTSTTEPNAGMAMLGSGLNMMDPMASTAPEEEDGYSYWVGVNFPGFTDGDFFGIEYNHGSQHWRSFTYGEDTLIGSKIAARGDATEFYYNLPLVDKALTFQLRYTKIDYDYTGSNGFFGSATGTPMAIDQAAMMGMNPVKSASDLRATLRYTF